MTRSARTCSEADQLKLRTWVERGGRHGQRARVVLLSAEGHSADEVARTLGLTVPTVYKWRKRFRLEGCAGLRDRARPGQPRRLSQARREELARLTSEELPPQGARWTIRSLARQCAVTQHQVRAVWQERDLARSVVSHNLLSGVSDAPRHHALCALLLVPSLSVAVLAPQPVAARNPARVDTSLHAGGCVRGAWLRSQRSAAGDAAAVLADLFAFMASVRDVHPSEPLWLVFASKAAFTVPHVIPTLTSRANIFVSGWNRADGWVQSVEASLTHMLREGEGTPSALLAAELVLRLRAHGEAGPFTWVRARSGAWQSVLARTALLPDSRVSAVSSRLA